MDFHRKWKKIFFAVQIEKTELNILQKNGIKTFFTFQDRREKLFLNLINPWLCIDKFLSSPIKIHRQLSPVNLNVNCGVISAERKRRARDWRKLFLIGGFYR